MDKIKARNICDLCLGMLILAVTAWGYKGRLCGNYCCVSGIVLGAAYITSFIYHRSTGKFLPAWLYADCSVSSMIIFIATLVMHLELYGAFIFIHIVDPMLMFAYWAFFCDHREMKSHLPVLTVAIFPVIYTVLAKIILMITGNCPFPASLILVGRTPALSAGIMLAVYLLFIAMGYGYHFANRAVRRRSVELSAEN